MDEALVNLKETLVFGTSDNGLTARCRNQRIERVRLNDEAIEEIVSNFSLRL
jgi:proteasome activator subunit 4